MDDRIGIIGSTQGVKASSRPSTRNTPAVLAQPSPPSASASPVSPALSRPPRPPADAPADAALAGAGQRAARDGVAALHGVSFTLWSIGG